MSAKSKTDLEAEIGFAAGLVPMLGFLERGWRVERGLPFSLPKKSGGIC